MYPAARLQRLYQIRSLRTLDTAKKLGVEITVEASRFDESGLVEAILSKGVIHRKV